jgi:hypothetical protein
MEIELSDEERTKCEVWSRVMGYHRPISAWNAGKQQEYLDRQMFQEAAVNTTFTADDPKLA